MSNAVTIVDYGSGNLLSVARAFEHCGAQVQVSSDPAVIAVADRLVLPGVGAFADAMGSLRGAGLVEPLLRFGETGRPFLGICLGMQMLANASEEFGMHEGLGLIPGRVRMIPDRDLAGAPLKRPHIGWSELQLPDELPSWQGTCLEDVAPGAAVYLVHSYHFAAADSANVLAECRYGGRKITSAIRSNAIVGCQFHPEKSGTVGLAIVRRFIAA